MVLPTNRLNMKKINTIFVIVLLSLLFVNCKSEKKEQNLPDLKQKEIQPFFQNDLSFEFEKAIFEERLNTLNYKDNFTSSEYLFSVFHPPQTA